MKRFLEYLYESKSNIALKEASMSIQDFLKHDMKYLNAVLDDIIQDKQVVLGDKKANIVLPITDEIVEKFKDFRMSPSKDLQTFNDIAKLANFRWTKVYKGKYTGIIGQSKGENAEPAVAYIFNHTAKNFKNLSDPIMKVLNDHQLDSDWIMSSILTAKKIQEKYAPGKYVAAHVNGNDFQALDETTAKVAKIFSGKPGIAEVFKIKTYVVKDLYTGMKDNWNKADIVLVKKNSQNINVFLNSTITSSGQFNSELNILIENDEIIPISLKAISPKAGLDNIEFKKEGNSDSIDHALESINNIRSIELILPKELVPDTNNASCYLKSDNGIKIQFRRQTDTEDNLSIELILIGARGGKPLTQIKQDLGIVKNDDYYEYFASENEFYTVANELLSNTSIRPISEKARKTDPTWYNRTCFKGLIGLIKAYYRKYDTNSTIEFFKYVYEKASGQNSKSIFYLITMK